MPGVKRLPFTPVVLVEVLAVDTERGLRSQVVAVNCAALVDVH